jgi:hypothetical protein
LISYNIQLILRNIPKRKIQIPKMENQTSYRSRLSANPVLGPTHCPHPPVLHKYKKGFQMKNLDRMGEPVPFTWNGDDFYRTKIGVIPTAIAYAIVSWVIYHYASEWATPGSANVSSRRVFEVPTKSAPINLSEDVLLT